MGCLLYAGLAVWLVVQHASMAGILPAKFLMSYGLRNIIPFISASASALTIKTFFFSFLIFNNLGVSPSTFASAVVYFGFGLSCFPVRLKR
jgi:hypothetical protein